MASLNDIPDDLLTPNKMNAFILWLDEHVITTHVRRELISLWQKQTGAKVPPGAWNPPPE